MDRLQAMRVFERVAELGSFTRAASELGLSRARVSEALAELESWLGVRLLHRTTRQVALSDDGRAYYERVSRILADLDDADALVARGRGAVRGRLRVAMPMALARSFVVPALPRLLARHPELGLEVRLHNRALHLLADGVDCAVSYGLPAEEGLVAQPLLETRLVTVAAPTYLAERGVPAEPAQLSGHACIGFLALDSARETPWAFLERGEPSALTPQGKLGFNSMDACVEAAVAGLGITQVLSVLARPALEAQLLRPLLEAFAAPGPGIYLVYPPHREASPRLRALLAFLREVFAAESPPRPARALSSAAPPRPARRRPRGARRTR